MIRTATVRASQIIKIIIIDDNRRDWTGLLRPVTDSIKLKICILIMPQFISWRE
jgi:hypothetical protein